MAHRGAVHRPEADFRVYLPHVVLHPRFHQLVHLRHLGRDGEGLAGGLPAQDTEVRDTSRLEIRAAERVTAWRWENARGSRLTQQPPRLQVALPGGLVGEADGDVDTDDG